MGWIIWGLVLPSCVVLAWWILRKPLRTVVEELHVDQARLLFRQQREWLEARFLTAVTKVEPLERPRWDGAQWLDKIHWARDHQTRRLLALVEVQFEAEPFGEELGGDPRHATALFEYRKGRWFADGKWLEATRPHEAFLHLGLFEPVAPPQRRV